MRSRRTDRRPGKLSKVRSSRNSSSRNVAGARPGRARCRGTRASRRRTRARRAPRPPRAAWCAGNGDASRIAGENRSGVVATPSTSMYCDDVRPIEIAEAEQQRRAAPCRSRRARPECAGRRRGAVERGEHAALEGRTLRDHHGAVLRRRATACRCRGGARRRSRPGSPRPRGARRRARDRRSARVAASRLLRACRRPRSPCPRAASSRCRRRRRGGPRPTWRRTRC